MRSIITGIASSVLTAGILLTSTACLSDASENPAPRISRGTRTVNPTPFPTVTVTENPRDVRTPPNVATPNGTVTRGTREFNTTPTITQGPAPITNPSTTSTCGAN